MRLNLLIDADDTLWENNIYFEQAFEEFVDYLDHSTLSAAIRTVPQAGVGVAVGPRRYVDDRQFSELRPRRLIGTSLAALCTPPVYTSPLKREAIRQHDGRH